ncbi:hypothetical protein [Phyllobacterium leguminum]|uniref:Tail assembly chaperone n=1 Tax=Phyllobacterium leguminum TaxID=314237 RepID=A0A318T8H2_9HYPH|nr:hypothetical protein [Phyllobacterium leguminum]PYE86915.1 hypothetical protein C7477_11853 [Phyllobacterium leguminum]
MADKTKPILDLTTMIERPKIAIDGQLYEIRSPDELSILDSQRFTLWGREIEALAKEPDSADALTAVIDVAARTVMVGVPDEVFDKLSGAQRRSVLDLFTTLLLRNRLGVAGAIADHLTQLIGEPSFRAFNASMAETQRGGSTKPRQP